MQGIASGVNNTVGQLAGLLMIAVLPAVAGLSGQSFSDPGFADGYQVAMRVCVALCLVSAVIAGLTIPARPEQAGPESDGEATSHPMADAGRCMVPSA
jgi:hypothetical protein